MAPSRSCIARWSKPWPSGACLSLELPAPPLRRAWAARTIRSEASPLESPRGAYQRRGRSRADGDLQEGGRDAAEEIEDQEFEAAHGILHIVAEDPEIQHVPYDMQDSPVQEHGGYERKPGKRHGMTELRQKCGAKGSRHGSVSEDKVLQKPRRKGNLVEEDCQIRPDED